MLALNKLVVIGTGLIGGSFALALRRAGQAAHIVGVGRSLASLERARALGRPGKPEDTADAVAFLCSDEAKYITAESMNVSGGEEPH